MTIERNVDGLKSHAKQKRQDALDRTEKAIQQLIKEGKKINFNTVAEAGSVSKAWLYDEPEIRERIKQLRKQSLVNRSIPSEQKMSSESNTAIKNMLMGNIKKLEEEKRKLSEQLQVAYGRVLETERLASQKERLERENQQLRQERDTLRTERDELTQKIADYEPKQVESVPINPSKVISMPTKNPQAKSISESIKDKLETAGIQLNTTLSKAIKAVSEEMVLDAIEAYKEALATDKIERPGAWLKTAIEQSWKPNGAVQVKSELDMFNEWFPLAKKRGLVVASQQEKGSIIIYTSEGQWVPFGRMLKDYPIELL